MNKHFYTPDHIEAFLENRLSQSERIQFQSELEKDPLLKNEVDLQEDIIESLKSSRKLELKNRLNKIEVGLTPSYTGVKIAASVILSGLIGWGIHSYLNNETPGATTKNQLSVSVDKNSSSEKPETIIFREEESVINNKQDVSPEESTNTIASKPDAKSLTSSPKKQPASISKSIENEKSIPVSRPQLLEQSESETFHSEETLTIPQGKVAQITENRSGIDVSVDKNSDKKFHYKYHDNKLFLYGNFDSRTYEILELNTYNGKQVYLNVEDNYYLLKSNQLEAAPLTKITDAKLIESLNKFSNK